MPAPNHRRRGLQPAFHPTSTRGAITVEYALAYLAIFLPLTFAVIYTAELLWIWHSAADFTRSGARYAATHCWQSGADNVLNFMRTNAPAMVDRQQFTDGTAQLAVTYYSRDPDTGTLTEFSCDGDCSTNCVPDTVTVAVRNYEFRYFLTYLGLSPIAMPDFQTSVPIESAGCDPEQGICLP
jgi:Flp pilus assembly protein TadG